MNEISPANLISNSEFQKAVSGDKELRRLFNEELTDSSVRNHELSVMLRTQVTIDKYRFPALTLGGLCLLELLESPFVASTGNDESPKISQMDILKALFIMKQREFAAEPVELICQRSWRLDKLQKSSNGLASPELTEKIEHANRRLEQAKDSFDAQLIDFYAECPDMDMQEAFEILQEILLQPGGFSMIPQRLQETEARKKNIFDADWLGRMITDVSEMTSSLPFYILWRMPLATVSYIIVQRLRKAGVKGIAHKTKSSEAMKRIKTMMLPFLNREEQLSQAT
tara:strand:+ start:762 stop:1613 length:852 start_codon:yes stop_codon:yes gene_type:complete